MSAAIARPSLIDYASTSSILDEIQNHHAIQAVNTIGILSFIHLFVAKIQAQTHIIVLSSCLGLAGVGSWSAYCTSKSGLIVALESFRRESEVAKRPIKTTLYCPFFIDDSPLFTKYGLTLFWSWFFRPISLACISRSIIQESLRTFPFHHEIWMPWFVYFTPLLRLLPTPIYDLIFKVSCVENIHH